MSGALGFAWVAGEKKNKVWEHRKCSTIHTRVVRRDGLLCVVVYCHRCEAWYFMPEMVVALVREASDPSIIFLFFLGEVGERVEQRDGGRKEWVPYSSVWATVRDVVVVPLPSTLPCL